VLDKTCISNSYIYLILPCDDKCHYAIAGRGIRLDMDHIPVLAMLKVLPQFIAVICYKVLAIMIPGPYA
jgi:hypothetical protein